jgi:hypothetical protein
MASDATGGSKKVKIGGKEVMLKNKSHFKKSVGDEAGCAAKKGVVTSKIQGKIYFNAWSMDVKFEGQNVVRHLDLTTHNHSSFPGNSPVWPYLDKSTVKNATGPCENDIKKEKAACAEYTPHGTKDACAELANSKPPQKKRDISKPLADSLADETALHDCLSARRCSLQTYKPNTCCPPQTPHHLVEASALFEKRPDGEKGNPLATFPNGPTKYDEGSAPCVCAEGTSHALGGTHELMHTLQSSAAMKCPKKDLPLADGNTTNSRATTYGAAKKSAIEAFQQVFRDSGCDPKCIEAQLDNYHHQCGINDDTEIKAVATREVTDDMVRQAIAEANLRYSEVLLKRLSKAYG